LRDGRAICQPLVDPVRVLTEVDLKADMVHDLVPPLVVPDGDDGEEVVKPLTVFPEIGEHDLAFLVGAEGALELYDGLVLCFGLSLIAWVDASVGGLQEATVATQDLGFVLVAGEPTERVGAVDDGTVRPTDVDDHEGARVVHGAEVHFGIPAVGDAGEDVDEVEPRFGVEEGAGGGGIRGTWERRRQG
jgi:hypothetical protein